MKRAVFKILTVSLLYSLLFVSVFCTGCTNNPESGYELMTYVMEWEINLPDTKVVYLQPKTCTNGLNVFLIYI